MHDPEYPRPTVEFDTGPRDGMRLSYPEACRRSAQVYREEADCHDPGEERDRAVAKAEAFEAAADAWDDCPYPAGGCSNRSCTIIAGYRAHKRTTTVKAHSLRVQPLGEPDAPWTELPGVAEVTLGFDGGTSDDDGLLVVGALPTVEVTGGRQLTEEERNEIAALTDGKPERIPNRLIYADEVTVGMRVLYDRPCPHKGMAAVLAGPHEHGHATAVVVRIRQGEGGMSHIISAVVEDEEGEQQPRAWHTVELVRVAV